MHAHHCRGDGASPRFDCRRGTGELHAPFLPHRPVRPETLEILDHPLIEGIAGQRGAVADHQQLAPRSVRATFIRRTSARKPISPLWVGSHQRNHHGLLLAALKTVHAVDLQAGHRQQFAAAAAPGPRKGRSRRCPRRQPQSNNSCTLRPTNSASGGFSRLSPSGSGSSS